MEPNLEAQIEKRLAELPEDIRAAVMAADLNTQVQTIGAKYQLHIDQQGTLGDEILLAMLGFTELDKLESHVQTQVGVGADVASKIMQEVSAQIFLPIRESLLEFGAEQVAKPKPELFEKNTSPESLSQRSSGSLVLPVLPDGVGEARPFAQKIPAPVSLAAEKMLTEKTVTPVGPKKIDPYREPIE